MIRKFIVVVVFAWDCYRIARELENVVISFRKQEIMAAWAWSWHLRWRRG